MQVPTESRKPLFSMCVIFLLFALVLSGCSGKGSAITSTPPSPNATVSVSLSPSAIMPGQSATLSWTSSNANACTASGAWSGTLKTSGSTTVTLQGAAAQSYTLTCSGAGLPSQNTATLAVSQEQGVC